MKQKVAQNRLKHGLSGGTFKVIEGEMQEMFEEFPQGLIRAHQPVDEYELDLVGQMARSSWMSDRAVRFQNACFLVQPRTEEEKARGTADVAVRKDLDLHLRYQTTHDRAYSRAAADLHKHRETKRLAELALNGKNGLKPTKSENRIRSAAGKMKNSAANMPLSSVKIAKIASRNSTT